MKNILLFYKSRREDHRTCTVDESPTNHVLKYNTSAISHMLELGKGRMNNMNMYHLLRKAENELCSDIVLREPQECTPVEIKNSVVEAGSHPIC